MKNNFHYLFYLFYLFLFISYSFAQTELSEILMINIYPNTLTSSLIKIVNEYQITNFNLVGKWTEKRAKEVISFIKSKSKSKSLIAVDEEGYISRFVQLKSVAQSNLNDEFSAEQEAERRAKFLRRAGINVVFSPVLDFTTDSNTYIYKRTFQKNKELTAKLGAAMVRGYQKKSLTSIPKHFPCYRNDKNDPHGNISIESKIEEFNDCFDIFRYVINETKPNGIMVGHNLVNNKPVTRSLEFVDFIRKDFGFDGILVTDSIGMKSFFINDNLGIAAKQSIMAGYDLIILPSNFKASFMIIDFLKEEYKNDLSFRLRAEKSYEKIKNIKNFVNN